MRDVDDFQNDAQWVGGALGRLSTVPVPAALEVRILGDFDRLTERRRASWLAPLLETIWPGAPAWRPAAALAGALAVGLAMGVLVPLGDEASATEQSASVMLDALPAFEIGENS